MSSLSENNAEMDALSEEFMKFKISDPETFDQRSCATTYYQGSCGFAGSASQCFLRNLRTDRSIRATIETKEQTWDSKYYTRVDVHDIPAGGYKYLGCTRSDSAAYSTYSYSLLGCQLL